MEKFFEFLRSVVAERLGIEGVLVIALAGLAVYAWFQHHRAKLLQERIDLEAERRKTVADALIKLEAQYEKTRETNAPESLHRGRKRVLIAEDEVTLRNSMALLLGANANPDVPDVDVTTVRDGQEALDSIASNKPDALILDLAMPRKNGWDVLSELSRTKTYLPILILTGYANSREEVLQQAKAYLPGVIFRAKPALPEELLEDLKRLMSNSPRPPAQ